MITFFSKFCLGLQKLERGSLKKPLLMGTAVLMAGSGLGVLANGYIWQQTRQLFYKNASAVPQREVAIVLGAKVYPNGIPSAVLQDRLLAAVELYRLGKVKKIIVSGDHMAKEYNEPGAMFKFLVAQGVPPSDVFMDHAGFRTFDTMARAKKVFGVKSAVICTQRFHLARSLYLASVYDIDAVGLESDLRRYRHHAINHMREFVARSFSLLDVHLFHTQPRYFGPPIDLDGDSRLSRGI